MNKLANEFYARDAVTVGRELIGKVLVHRVNGAELRARIVETEAYLGPRDLASHSSKGLTRRTEVMFGPAGRAYVYFIYGMYEMLNVVTGVTGEAHAVLLRAGEPVDGRVVDLSGPGKLARGMGIRMDQNGVDLTSSGELFIADDGVVPRRILRAKRVGVDYAGRWKERLLRFYDGESMAVSRRPKAIGGSRSVRKRAAPRRSAPDAT